MKSRPAAVLALAAVALGVGCTSAQAQDAPPQGPDRPGPRADAPPRRPPERLTAEEEAIRERLQSLGYVGGPATVEDRLARLERAVHEMRALLERHHVAADGRERAEHEMRSHLDRTRAMHAEGGHARRGEGDSRPHPGRHGFGGPPPEFRDLDGDGDLDAPPGHPRRPPHGNDRPFAGPEHRPGMPPLHLDRAEEARLRAVLVPPDAAARFESFNAVVERMTRDVEHLKEHAERLAAESKRVAAEVERRTAELARLRADGTWEAAAEGARKEATDTDARAAAERKKAEEAAKKPADAPPAPDAPKPPK